MDNIKIKYHLCNANGNTIFNNLSEQEKILETQINSESGLFLNGKLRGGKISNHLGTITAITSDSELLKSSKQFKTLTHAVLNTIAYTEISINAQIEQINKNTARLLHNLRSLNAHNIQEVYSIISQDELSNKTKNHLEYVESKVKSKPRDVSISLLRIAKNNAAMKTEFSVFDKLFNQKLVLRPSSHTFHKVLMNVLYLFFPDFTDKDVYVKVEDSDAKAYFDYESIHVALYHMIDNAAKYTKPNSEIVITIKNKNKQTIIQFEMISLKILEDEKNTIFFEGISGEIPSKIGKSGNGIGMSLVKKILELNGGHISIEIDPTRSEALLSIEYQKNLFTFILPATKQSVREINSTS